MNSPASPFSPRAALALVVAGFALFVALVWAMGQGGGATGLNNGGGHARATGANGFAGFARLLEGDGWEVSYAREDGALARPGLLVLTPPADAKGSEIERIVARHRKLGPTIVVAPKWLAEVPPQLFAGRRAGWVRLIGTRPPEWPGFADDVTVDLKAEPGRAGWTAAGLRGRLPDGGSVLSGAGPRLVPLVAGGSGRMLAGYLADDGFYPTLDPLALAPSPRASAENTFVYPLVLVFEPDLLDNYGLADAANAELALRIAGALVPSAPRRVTFDLTLDGLGLPDNLLRLMVTPPYLAATLCLLMAAVLLGWRGFVRFGPPLAAARDVAFGKAVLVDQAGALIVRAKRWRLLGAPYAALVRERLARGLGLHGLGPQATEAAIDRALAARDPAAEPFSETARKLGEANREAALLAAARRLHEQAGMLKR